jgi:hypothetical protein
MALARPVAGQDNKFEAVGFYDALFQCPNDLIVAYGD